ncbi:MAG: hypothetical protein A2086_16475 [Spirochaetes bacterium GWD1_27_9]|nr:MAG: hypothetical protein A2Z98_01410 [Spirochaetes bacterium GWB1_27_13]OHD28302.1 MAG: hypothetical protein A2Y34_09815 [Spirochaetes bacterium GWC1_27_15]OHD29190.1 MAG: hypothetical protein A2086_16475 [Spirochaetes bacterium GWD1_27_9]
MSRIFFVFILLFMFVLNVFAVDRAVVIYDEIKINGQVKKITGIEYKEFEEDGKKVRNNENTHILEFDNKGNVVKSKEIFSFWTKSYSYKYDDNGNMIEKAEYDEKDILNLTTIYIYKDGILIEENILNKEGQLSNKTTYKIENGKPVEMNHIYSDGSLLDRATYNYDKNGNLIEEIEYDSENAPSSKDTYKFNKNNKLIEKQVFKNDILNYKTTYNYIGDIKTEEIELEYEGNNVVSKTINKYNNKENRISFEKYEGKKLSVKIKYIYDLKNKIIEEDEMDSFGKITEKTIYSYDKNQNLVKKVEYTPDMTPIQFTEFIYEN